MRAFFYDRYVFAFLLLLFGSFSVLAGVATAQSVDISVEKTLIREDGTRIPAGTLALPVQHEDVEFEIVVTNHGPDDAWEVKIHDELSTIDGLKDRSVEPSATFTASPPDAGYWTIASLPANASTTLYLRGTIDDLVWFSNTATLYGMGAGLVDSNSSNNQSVVEVEPQKPVIDVSVTKTASTDWVTPGQEFFYTIVVGNHASATGKAKFVYVEDLFPANFTASAVVPAPFSAGPPLVLKIDNLKPGESETYTITGMFEPGTPAGSYENCADITSVRNGHFEATPGDYHDCATVDVGGAAPDPKIDLELTKTASPSEVEQGGSILFTLNVTNNSLNATVAATEVFVKDYVPFSLFSSIDPDPAFASIAEPYTWIVPSIAPGASVLLTINATLEHYAQLGSHKNCAEVWDAKPYGKDADSETGEEGGELVGSSPAQDDESCVSFWVVEPAPDPTVKVSLTKSLTQAGPFLVGQPINFKVAYDVVGGPATNLVIRDEPQQAQVGIDQVYDGGTIVGSGAEWAFASLSGAGAVYIDLTASQPGTYENCARVSALDQTNTSPQTESCVWFRVVRPEPDPFVDLSIEKTLFPDPGPFEVGAPFTFRIKVSNAASATATATNVRIDDFFVGGLSVISGTPGYFNATESAWVIPSIAPGDTETLTITMTGDVAATLSNCAIIEGADQNDIGTQQESCANVTLWAPQPDPDVIDLEVVKTVSDGSPAKGQLITYTINITNDSNATATAENIYVHDVLPSGVTFEWAAINAPGQTDTFTAPQSTFLIDALEPGEFGILTIGVVVDQNASGTIVNCAQIWETGDGLPDADSKSALQNDGVTATGDSRECEPITVKPSQPGPEYIDLELTKTASSNWVKQGGTILFTINVSNNAEYATLNATDIYVKDILPQGVFFSTVVEPPFANWASEPNTWVIDSLAPGEFALLTINATIGHYAPIGTFENCAEIWDARPLNGDFDSKTGEEGGSFRPNDDDQGCAWFDVVEYYEPKPDQIDLEVTKTVNGTKSMDVYPGDLVVYEITVTNNKDHATIDATDINVRDVLPAGLEYPVAIPVFASYNTWKIPVLAPGASAVLTLKAKVAHDAPTSIENCAEVYFATPSNADYDSTPAWIGGTSDEDDRDCAWLRVKGKPAGKVDLELTKRLKSSGSPALGEVIEFEITVTNNPKDDYGAARPTSTATNVWVTDYLPAGLSLQSFEPMGPGGNVIGTDVEGNFYGGTRITWELKKVEVYQTITFKVFAKLTGDWASHSDGYGKLTNCAEIWDADQKDHDSVDGNRAGERLKGGPAAEDDQDCASVIPNAPVKADLSLEKKVDNAMPKPGDEVTFTVTVHNSGAPTYGVKITDLIDDPYDCFTLNESDVFVSSGSVSYLSQDGLIWTVDVHYTEVLRVSGWVTCETPFTNRAWIKDSGSAPDASTGNDEASVTVTPKQPAPQEIDLSLAKKVSTRYPSAGQKVEFVITVANAGPADATGVQVIDYLPSGLEYVYGSATDGYGIRFNDYNFSWEIDKIRAGSSVDLVFKVKAPYEGEYKNCAEVWDADQHDRDSSTGAESATDWTRYDREDDEDCARVWVSGAPPVSDAVCYLVADNDGAGYGSPDVLTKLGSDGHYETVVGPTGTEMIEAIAFNPWNGKLYAADARRLGIIDTYTGYFSPIGEFGNGDGKDHYGVHRTRGLLDVDGLAFDPHTEELYGVVRKVGEADLLFKIDPATGHRVDDAFGYGIEYVTISSVNGLEDVDDIAIDPEDGTMYGINNIDGEHSRLVKINKQTGHVVDVRQLPVGNVEGLAFFADGTLYGTGGEGEEVILVIDKYSLNIDVIAAIGTDGNRDYEAIDCLTTPVNEYRVTIFDDVNANGVQEFGEGGFSGQAVEVFRDRNESGAIDAGDVLLSITTSDQDGRAVFSPAANGMFLFRLGADTMPAGASYTTAEYALASFGGFGSRETGAVGLSGASATSTASEFGGELPDAFTLEGNYPNPFNPSTSITFALPETGQVRLAVYDLLGREMALLVDGSLAAGRHQVSFDATSLVSGTYLYRLDAGGQTFAKTMTLLK